MRQAGIKTKLTGRTMQHKKIAKQTNRCFFSFNEINKITPLAKNRDSVYGKYIKIKLGMKDKRRISFLLKLKFVAKNEKLKIKTKKLKTEMPMELNPDNFQIIGNNGKKAVLVLS